MEIIKVVLTSIVICIAIVLVRQLKPEFTVIITLAGSVILLIFIIDMFTPILSEINLIIEKTKLDSSLYKNIIKVVGIGYLTEFAANICIDTGNKSIASKTQLAGKVIILALSLPIITELINIIASLL